MWFRKKEQPASPFPTALVIDEAYLKKRSDDIVRKALFLDTLTILTVEEKISLTNDARDVLLTHISEYMKQ